jgi:hypothetical protein
MSHPRTPDKLCAKVLGHREQCGFTSLYLHRSYLIWQFSPTGSVPLSPVSRKKALEYAEKLEDYSDKGGHQFVGSEYLDTQG